MSSTTTNSTRHLTARAITSMVAGAVIAASSLVGGCRAPAVDAEAPRIVQSEVPPAASIVRRAPQPAATAAAGAGAPSAEASPLAPPAPLPPPDPQVHQFHVGRGETLGLYERWSGICKDDIRRQNKLKRRGLRAGESFRIRMGPDQKSAFERMRKEFHRNREDEFFRTHEVTDILLYVVQPGDNLRAIARRYNEKTPLWLMERVNPRSSLRSLHPGDQLNVPIVVEAAPTSADGIAARQRVLDARNPGQPSGRGAMTHQRPPSVARSRPVAAQGAPLAPGARIGDAHTDGGVSAGWFSDDEPDDVVPPARVSVKLRVRRGEYLGLYARWSGTPVSEILAANGLADPRALRAGQELDIPILETRVRGFYDERRLRASGGQAAAVADEPAAQAADGSWVYYQVKSGESAWIIASRRLKVSMASLKQLNPGVNLNRLRAGQKIRVPASVLHE